MALFLIYVTQTFDDEGSLLFGVVAAGWLCFMKELLIVRQRLHAA
jgi:hypothetical protein